MRSRPKKAFDVAVVLLEQPRRVRDVLLPPLVAALQLHRLAQHLGDIRTYFPKPVVQVMQRDAIERLDDEMGSLAARHQAAAPEEAVAIEDHLVVLDERLNQALRAHKLFQVDRDRREQKICSRLAIEREG